MLPIVRSALALGLLLVTTTAAAQTGGSSVSPQPVSPGGAARATLAGSCPSFSWAPSQWAAGYDLAVFEVNSSGRLAASPILRTALPGSAGTWTPSVADCLRVGTEYVWFIREVGHSGEAIGTWSDGLSFVVVDTSRPVEAATATSDDAPQSAGGNAVAFAGAAAPVDPRDKPEDPGRATPPPTNQEILNRINDVLAILNEPEPHFSVELCSEPALQGELEAGSQVILDGTLEGRVGAEGYGNGAMIRLKGAPASKLEGKVKGAWDILKLGACWDILATVRNRQAAAALAPAPAGGSRVAGPAALDTAGDLADVIGGLDLNLLQQKMQTLSTKLGFDLAASIDALQALGDFSLQSGPFAALQEGGIFQQLAGNLPLPPNVRTLLEDPSSILSEFQALRSQGLCNVNLPPALSGPIGQICGLIAGEPFSKLLNRVDTVTQFISDALPTSDNCKLFCRD